jgi:alcohol dehydrogenase class IV
LSAAGIESDTFSEVEPNPSLQTVERGAEVMRAYKPDWIVGLGGGSSMDAAKAMWILYERPDVSPDAINPLDELGLRQKARLICIPTTAGSGSEASYGVVLTDTEGHRKLTLGTREVMADLAIVDPRFTSQLPKQLTADTGIDVFSHAIEGFSSSWANDLTDGCCLQAARLVFEFLPRAVAAGSEDPEAREKMANAATLAGMALGNSQVALAHAMGHSAGVQFPQISHGRITAVFLPGTIEYVARGGNGRYLELATILHLPDADEAQSAASLSLATRKLMGQIGLPTSLEAAGIAEGEFEAALPLMCQVVDVDVNTLMSRRIPEYDHIERLFRYAYKGWPVDF